MDFILLNNDGSLNRQELKRYLQQGDHGVDNIFIVWNPGLSTDTVQAVFTLPNQTTNTALLTYKANYPYEADDPEELLEDPAALQEYIDNGGEISNGWVLTLTEEQTRYYGLLFTSVRFIRNGIVQVAYPFTLVINETGVRPETDSGVTLAQLDSYLLNLQSLVTGAVQQNTDSQLSETSENPVQNKVITTFVKNVVAGVYKIGGSDTPTNLDALTKDESLNGYVYNISTNGSLTNEDASTLSVQEGDNVVFVWNDGEWYWDRMAGFIDTSDLVTLSTEQTISGKKTFSGDTYFTGNAHFQTTSYLSECYCYGSLYSAGTNDLGSSSYPWQNIYLSDAILFKNATPSTYWRQQADVSGNLVFGFGTDGLNWSYAGWFDSQGSIYLRNVTPITANTYNLGDGSRTWQNLHLSGKSFYYNSSTTKYAYMTLDQWGNLNIGMNVGTGEYNYFAFSNTEFFPTSSGSKSLGTADYTWKELNLGSSTTAGVGKITFYNPAQSNQGNWYITSLSQTEGIQIAQVGQSGITIKRPIIEPNTDDYWSLGSSNSRYKNVFASGVISDGANQADVTKIISTANNRLYKHRFILGGGAYNLSFDCMLKSATPITSPDVFVTFADSIRNSVGYRGQSGMPTELIVISRITGGSTPVIFYYTNSASGESSQIITTITDTIID